MNRKVPVKIVLAGDGGTGKSTLLKLKSTGNFDYSCDITIGVDFGCVELLCKEQTIPILIYDLGGQERFQFLHDSYIIGTKAGIVLYDLTREKTFYNIEKWIKLLYQENPEIPIIIAGSKKDLTNQEDLDHFQKKFETLNMKLSQKYKIIKHVFISSKLGEGVDQIFNDLLNMINLVPFFPPISQVLSV